MAQIKRTLDGLYEPISGANYPTKEAQAAAYSDIQRVGEIGAPGSYLAGIRRPASNNQGTLPGVSATPSTPSSDNPADIFNLLMVDSLKKAQGVNTADLYKRKRELERATLGGQQEITPEALRTFSPAQQEAIRSGKIAPLQSEIDENAYEIKRAENAISNFENVFQNVMKISSDYAEKMVAPESVIANYKKLIESDPEKMNTYLANVNDKTKEAILSSLDYNKMKPKAISQEPSISEQIAAAEKGYNIVNGRIQKTDGTTDPITGAVTDPTKIIKVRNKAYNFTSYATDPNWGVGVNNILSSLPVFTSNQEVNNYIQSQAPGSKLRAEDIESVANEAGISPELLLSIAKHESNFMTAGVGARTNNPGNVGNVDGGGTQSFSTPKEGLMAIANNILKREVDTTKLGNVDDKASDFAVKNVKTIFGGNPSEGERQAVIDFYKRKVSEGITDEQDILNEFVDFKVSPEYKDLGSNLRDVVTQNLDLGRTFKEFGARDLANLINAGKTPEAVRKVELYAYGKAKANDPDNFISESTVKLATENVNELDNLINQLDASGKNPIGNFSGSLQDWLGRFKGKEATAIKGKIVNLVSKMRKDLSGSAVTPSEEKFLSPLIPILGDTTENVLTKTTALKENPLNRLNSVRTSYGMPELNENTLLDQKQRVGLYGGKTENSGEITVISPDGIEGIIPANQLEEALKEGYKQK